MRLVRATLVLPLLLPLQGCLVAAAAAGVAYGIVKHDNNETVVNYKVRVDRLWSATIQALEARGYEVPAGTARSWSESEDRAVVKGDNYWLKIEELPQRRSVLRIRIGTFQSKENKRKAELLIDSIARRL